MGVVAVGAEIDKKAAVAAGVVGVGLVVIEIAVGWRSVLASAVAVVGVVQAVEDAAVGYHLET